MGLRFVSKMRVLSLLGLIASCCCAHTSAFSTTSGVTGAIAASRSKIQVPLYTRNSRPGKTYANAGMSTFRESLALHAEASSSSSSALVPSKVLKAAKSLHRISWLSWWSQVILTTISAVTLLFARSVGAAGKNNLTQRVDGSFLAGTGIVLSIFSIFWTWGGARLSNRLTRRKETSELSAASMIRKAVKVGTSINLLGMLVTLIGAQVIVGTLAAKVLSMQGVSPFGVGGAAAAAVATQTLQPLDILVVQANTNTLLSHFIGLSCTSFLSRWIDKLDPPSKR